MPYDIIILGGQSNAEGNGVGNTESPYEPDDRILMMHDNRWYGYVKDENGKPMKDVEISVKRISNGVVTNLGKTDVNGKVNGEGFSYGEYEIIQKTPSGYTCAHSTQKVSLTTKNNSLNAVTFTNKKEDKKPAESSKEDVSDSSELSN